MTLIDFCLGYLAVCVPCFIALLIAMKIWGEEGSDERV